LIAGEDHATAVLGEGPWRGWTADGRVLVSEVATTRAFLVEPTDGRRTHVFSGRTAVLLDVSIDGSRALLRYGPRSARRLMVVDIASGDATTVLTGKGAGTADLGALSPDGHCVIARTDVDRDFAALVAAPTDGGDARTLAMRPATELQGFTLDPSRKRAALVWSVRGGRSELSVLDIDVGHELIVGTLPRDVVDECRFDRAGSQLLITAESWADPRGVWLLGLGDDAARPISSPGGEVLRSSRGAEPSVVHVSDLAAPELREFSSYDGTGLTAWFYAPEGSPPWPTMIHLHGGPEAQERPVYNSLFQSLVAAGVAVLAPNVRGSTGFGRVFESADNLAGRYGAIDDVAACARHLVNSALAPPQQIGVMGRSYGGYLTLAALVWHPELFAVGVDVCGIANFLTFFQNTERWIAETAVTKYGDPLRDEALLRDLSPINKIDRLRAPLLVVHGARDTNVPVSEAEQVVTALQSREIDGELLLFPDEGHELLKTHNRVRFVERTVGWVVGHLATSAETSVLVSSRNP
jgi:alpha-beta hydrolase superfamily lysophospholipase